MISDVSFDLAGSSAIAALSPNGWHLAVVRHGVAIDFFDARDLCSSTPSTAATAGGASNVNDSAAAGGASTNMRSRQRKLGSLQGSVSTTDDVSSLVWSPDSTMVAAVMEARGALAVVSAFAPFSVVATVEGALNGARAHVLWHPSSRAVYWSGLAQTHVLNLSDGATMVLDYHAKVVAEDPRADTAASSTPAVVNGQHRSSPLPLWALGEPCPSHTTAGASSPTSSRLLMCFTNGDGAAAREYREAMNNSNGGSNGVNNAAGSHSSVRGVATSAGGGARAKNDASSSAAAVPCPPLFLCMISPCSVAAVPGTAGGNVHGIRAGMQVVDPNSQQQQQGFAQVLVNMSSAQSVASTTAVLEEAAGVNGAPFNSRISVTTEFFHVFSSLTHEHIFSFPIALASSSTGGGGKNDHGSETGGEFFSTSFAVSPCFIAVHDSFSCKLAVFSHQGANIGPNVRHASAYAVSSSESVDYGSTLAVVHSMSTLSIFCAVSAGGSSPLIPLVNVDLAKPETYLGFSPSSASQQQQPQLVVLSERQAPDDLLERARNEAMTEKAVAAHRADPAHTLPAVPPNRSMYEVLMPSASSAVRVGANGEEAEDRDASSLLVGDMSRAASGASSPTLSLVPGLRGKSLLGLCYDAQSRQIVEEFVRHTMRKTEVRNMMDDVMNGKVKKQQQTAARRNSGANTTTTTTTSKVSLAGNLSQVSSELLSEIAPLAFRDFGLCAVTSFHSAAEHSDRLYVACTVPMFPTCVWVVDVAAGSVVSVLQQKHVVTTLTWKPPRDVLVAHQQQQHATAAASGIGGAAHSRMRPLHHLEDPVLAFTTDSHVGSLYLWTPESALCVAMPEIAKVASHMQQQQQQRALSDKSANGFDNNGNGGASFECRMHISCENPNCRRNWLFRQREIERRRAFERGELGGFRCTCSAWTDSGNTLLLIDTVRGSHVCASLIAGQ